MTAPATVVCTLKHLIFMQDEWLRHFLDLALWYQIPELGARIAKQATQSGWSLIALAHLAGASKPWGSGLQADIVHAMLQSPDSTLERLSNTLMPRVLSTEEVSFLLSGGKAAWILT